MNAKEKAALAPIAIPIFIIFLGFVAFQFYDSLDKYSDGETAEITQNGRESFNIIKFGMDIWDAIDTAVFFLGIIVGVILIAKKLGWFGE